MSLLIYSSRDEEFGFISQEVHLTYAQSCQKKLEKEKVITIQKCQPIEELVKNLSAEAQKKLSSQTRPIDNVAVILDIDLLKKHLKGFYYEIYDNGEYDRPPSIDSYEISLITPTQKG